MSFESVNSIWSDLNVIIVWKLFEVDAPITNWVIVIELQNYWITELHTFNSSIEKK